MNDREHMIRDLAGTGAVYGYDVKEEGDNVRVTAADKTSTLYSVSPDGRFKLIEEEKKVEDEKEEIGEDGKKKEKKSKDGSLSASELTAGMRDSFKKNPPKTESQLLEEQEAANAADEQKRQARVSGKDYKPSTTTLQRESAESDLNRKLPSEQAPDQIRRDPRDR